MRSSPLSSRLLTISLVLALASPSARAHESIDIVLARLSQAVEARPNDADILVARGEHLRGAHHFEAALSDFQRAQSLDPTRREIHFYRGRLYLERGKPERAKRSFSLYLESGRAADYPATAATALAYRARCSTALGLHDSAVADYEAAIQIHPAARPGLYLAAARAILTPSGEAAGRLAPRVAERALASLDAGIARLGPVAALEALAIELEMGRGRTEEALKRLDAIFANAKRRDAWRERRGQLLLAAGRPDAARQEFEAALRELETLPPARQRTPVTTARRSRLTNTLRRLDP